MEMVCLSLGLVELSLLAALLSFEFVVWKSGSVLEGQCFAVGLFQFSIPVPRFSFLSHEIQVQSASQGQIQ